MVTLVSCNVSSVIQGLSEISSRSRKFPLCPECDEIVKSDGVMFGKHIPTNVLEKYQIEVARCDSMLILGTSAVVYLAVSFPQITMSQGAILIEVNSYDTVLSRLCDVVL